MAVEIACPVCRSVCDARPLYRYTSAQAANFFCPPTRDKDRNGRLEKSIAELWHGENCIVLRCSMCGFSFGHPFLGGNEVFYSILHEQHGYPKWRWDYDVAVEFVLKPIGGGKIVDVGAGNGAFLMALEKSWERFAIEGGPTTREMLKSKGITVFPSLAEAAQATPHTFHAVTMFQVLEHLSDVHQTLAWCRQLLVPGGKLVVTVPDGDAMIRQEELTGCPDMPPHHVGKWTPKSLSHALRSAGLAPSEATYEPASVKSIVGALHLKILADAAKPHTLAAQVYRFRRRRIRVALLATLGVFALLRLSPHLNELRRGGTFAMTAVAP